MSLFTILIIYLSIYVFSIGSMIIYLTNISMKYGNNRPVKHINHRVLGAKRHTESHQVFCYVDRSRNKNPKIKSKNTISYMILKEYLGQKKKGTFIR